MYIYIVTGLRITRQGGVSKCPRRVSLLKVSWGADFSLSWVGALCSPKDLCSCFPVAVPPCRARVRGLAGQTLLSGINADQELAWSLLETCLTSVCVEAAYQALP